MFTTKKKTSSISIKTYRLEILLLGGIWFLACISMIGVMLLILNRQPLALASNPGLQPVQNANHIHIADLNQYPLATTAASTWAADAQLISANAAWSYLLNRDQINQPVSWIYRFYSPARERLLFVIIEPDGQIRTIEHVAKTSLPPSVISPDDQLVDSSTALNTWLEQGGDKMLRTNPGFDLIIRLHKPANKFEPVWSVMGLDRRTGTMHVVDIQAGQSLVTNISSKS